MKRTRVSGGLLLACLMYAGSAHAVLITSAGSTTVQPALKACSTAYRATHADVQFIIAGGGSSKGVNTVGRGRVDLGRASRPIKAKEMKQFPNVKAYKIGIDGVALVVNAQNSIAQLSSDQVKKIFSGELSNWSQLGGDDAAVHLISLGTEHGTYELFSKFFHLKGVESEGNLEFGKGHAWIAFSQDVAMDKVAGDVAAITFASIGVAQAFADETGKIKLIDLDGVAATEGNVASGKYAMVRPLLLLTHGEPKGEVKSFIEFSRAPECQSIVKKLGYIPVK